MITINDTLFIYLNYTDESSIDETLSPIFIIVWLNVY